MFVYNGSKLEQDIEDLKNKVGKSEYEKIVEPYQKRITTLEMEIWTLKSDLDALYSASRELLNSIDQNYLNIIVNTHEPKAYYSKGVDFEIIDEHEYVKLAIPVKQDIKEQFDIRLRSYINKHAEIFIKENK